MHQELSLQEDLTKKMVFFLKKIQLSFKFLFCKKAIVVIDNKVHNLNHMETEIEKKITAMFHGVLIRQNKNFNEELNEIFKNLKIITC